MIVRSTLALLVFASAISWSQVATARLEGYVQDSSGARVPKAIVTATNERTQIVTRVEANDEGFYIFPSLPSSVYSLAGEANGFRRAVIQNIELYAASAAQQNIVLEVGSVAETVTVEANVVRVQTTDAQVGSTVTLKDIETLPQLGRGPLALAIFQPGIQINPGDTSFSRVNGTRQGSTNVRLDGIDANDAVVPRLGLSMTAVNVDSVSEMRVITNGFKAEYGRNAGGEIEMITRSGGSRWSGSLFEFLRNTKLNANTFFNNSSGVARPKFVQNIFGGSIGGPLWKNKTFGFFNYQGQRTSQDVTRNRFVFTDEARQGVFRWRPPGSTAIQSANMFALDPKGVGIDPQVREALSIMPPSNNTDIGDGLNTAGFRFNNPAGAQNDQWTYKIDHQLTQNHRIFFRQSRFETFSIDALNGAEARYPGRPQGNQGGIRWGFSVGSDWVISPSLINEFRAGYQSATVAFVRPDRPAGLGLDFVTVDDPINLAFAQGRNSPVKDFTDNVTWLKGRATWKFGFNTRRTLQFGYNDAGIYPNVSFSRANGNIPTVGPTGAIISSADRQRFEEVYNDLLGRVSQISQTFYSDLDKFQAAGTPRVRNFDFVDYGAFAQNDFKLTKRVTLNLGLRWEQFGAPSERDSLQGRIDRPELVHEANRISDFRVVRDASWYDTARKSFAPRFGFAWDVFGDGRTAIRGSYGIFYDRMIGATTSLVDGNTPGFSQGVLNLSARDFPADTRVNQNPPLPAQPPAPILQQPLTRQTSIVAFQPGLPNGYVQHFNFNIQREIARNTVLDVGWVRTKGVKLFTWRDVNQPRIEGDFINAFNELERFRATGAAPSANNTLVRIFGTPTAAVTSIGATTLQQGLVGTAAGTVDQTFYPRYAAAGVSDFYLRNFPQYNQVLRGDNNGLSWYDSLQVSFRRQAGDLRFFVNYTWSKSLDNTSVDGNGFTAPIDNYNLNLNKGRGDFDRPHSLNYSVIYAIPVGKGKRFGSSMPGVANALIGNWELGFLGIAQSGSTFTVGSGRRTAGSTSGTWANYSGDRNIGTVYRDNAIFWFTPAQAAQFTFPGPGEIGTSGRNAFRGPGFFNMDVSIVKNFPLWWERHRVSVRAELYNMWNNVNFANPGASVATPQTLGRISTTVGNPRIAQIALRYDF